MDPTNIINDDLSKMQKCKMIVRLSSGATISDNILYLYDINEYKSIYDLVYKYNLYFDKVMLHYGKYKKGEYGKTFTLHNVEYINFPDDKIFEYLKNLKFDTITILKIIYIITSVRQYYIPIKLNSVDEINEIIKIFMQFKVVSFGTYDSTLEKLFLVSDLGISSLFVCVISNCRLPTSVL